MAMNATDLAGMRTAVTAMLADSGHVTRTGATVACSVDADTRETHLRNAPDLLRMQRWRITLSDGTDVRAGDVLTIAGKGSYLIGFSTNPTTISTDTSVRAILANATVTFVRLKTQTLPTLQVTSPVLIYAASDAGRPSDEAIEYDWGVVIPGSLTYSDGRSIGPDHQILWDQMGTLTGGAIRPKALKKPRRTMGPGGTVAYLTAYFKEQD